jgi:hypothetical protein
VPTTTASQKRKVNPKGPVVVSAAMVSQLTCLSLLGVDPRRYLDHVVPLCTGHVVPLGKLRLIPLDRAVDALRSLSVDESTASDHHPVDIVEGVTADTLLARLGRTRASAR